MALVKNGSLLYGGPNKYSATAATLAGGAGEVARNQTTSQRGRHYNFQSGSHAVTDVTNKAGWPQGKGKTSWQLPQKSGAISSYREATATITLAATGAKGLNGVMGTTVTVGLSAIGGLIAGGVASATITIGGSATVFGAILGTATATVTVGAAATASAIGHAVASGDVTVSGSVVPYAIGWMESTSEYGNDLTPSNLAAAVWNAVAASYNSSGTMGNKLNAAGTAGDPWTADEADYTTPGQMGYVMAQTIQKILRNKTITDPTTGVMTVYDDDGVTPFITANVYQDADGLTNYQGQGADRRERLE